MLHLLVGGGGGGDVSSAPAMLHLCLGSETVRRLRLSTTILVLTGDSAHCDSLTIRTSLEPKESLTAE